jgi:ABC-type polysaccharide/polyol phosphate export permease
MLVALVERRLRLNAKRAWVSVAWPSISPMVMLGLYWFVFSRVFKVPVAHYGEFLFAGLLPWSFLSQSLTVSIQSLSSEQDLIRRSPFRHELLPLAAVSTMVLYMVVALAGFVVYLALHGRLSVVLLAALPVPLVALFLLAASLSMLIAICDVYNRDLRWVMGNLMTVWFFLLPIVYRRDMAPGSLQALRSIDPMNMIVGQFRDILYYRHLSRPAHMVLMLAVTSALFAGSLYLFRSVSAELPKDV